MMTVKILIVILSFAFMADLIDGHGMLMNPINRASRWRFNSSAPRNWDDNALYCGGYEIQHFKNNGKCGLCGDNWANPRPRPHEIGGQFGEGVIVKTYKVGQQIESVARLTYNHLGGKFYYNLCNLDGGSESDECFEKYPIKTADGKDYYQLTSFKHQDFTVNLKLPDNLRCNHCVLQWTYVTANSWGFCQNQKGGRLGCGPQENFRTCSDIRIL